MKTAIFSGRFDPPSLGHVLTIQNILTKYSKILVITLDYPGRAGCNADTAEALFRKVFSYLEFDWLYHSEKGVKFIQNKEHFGVITKMELKILLVNNGITDFDKAIYAGGNLAVNSHIEKLGCIDVEFIPRTIIYNSTAIRDKIAQGVSLEDQYNIKLEEMGN